MDTAALPSSIPRPSRQVRRRPRRALRRGRDRRGSRRHRRRHRSGGRRRLGPALGRAPGRRRSRRTRRALSLRRQGHRRGQHARAPHRQLLASSPALEAAFEAGVDVRLGTQPASAFSRTDPAPRACPRPWSASPTANAPGWSATVPPSFCDPAPPRPRHLLRGLRDAGRRRRPRPPHPRPEIRRLRRTQDRRPRLGRPRHRDRSSPARPRAWTSRLSSRSSPRSKPPAPSLGAGRRRDTGPCRPRHPPRRLGRDRRHRCRGRAGRGGEAATIACDTIALALGRGARRRPRRRRRGGRLPGRPRRFRACHRRRRLDLAPPRLRRRRLHRRLPRPVGGGRCRGPRPRRGLPALAHLGRGEALPPSPSRRSTPPRPTASHGCAPSPRPRHRRRDLPLRGGHPRRASRRPPAALPRRRDRPLPAPSTSSPRTASRTRTS